MGLNYYSVLASAVPSNLYFSYVHVYLTTFSQICRLYYAEWGTFASAFNWDMAERGCGLFYGGFPKYSWR